MERLNLDVLIQTVEKDKKLSDCAKSALLTALNRLTELEAKIKNGTLVEPPCKLGDTVYCVIQPDDEEPYIDDMYKCESLRYYNGEWEITPTMDGWWWTIEKVCATHEEAEKRLEELKG